MNLYTKLNILILIIFADNKAIRYMSSKLIA